MSYSRAQRDAKLGIEPRTRVGICCGAMCMRYAKRRGKPDVTLHKVGDQFRYRCRSCYRRETGYYP